MLYSQKLTFLSAEKTATDGFSPGLKDTLVAPSILSLSMIPLDQSAGRYTCISGPTNRMACDSDIVN
jgi:hypothetical protein